MKINYHITFSEDVEDDVASIEPETMSDIAQYIKHHISKYLNLAGLNLTESDINLEFDLEE